MTVPTGTVTPVVAMTRARQAARLSCQWLAATLPVLFFSSATLAQDLEARNAEAAFKEGMALMKQGDYERACPRLEDSVRLDPAMAATYRWAECLERIGQLTKAWRQFTAVARLAHVAGMTEREQRALERVATLEPRLPRLVITVPDEVAALPNLRIVHNGKVVPPEEWTEPIAVDHGSHEVTVIARGKEPWSTEVVVGLEGTTTIVEVPLLGGGSDTRSSDDPPGNGQVIAGVVVASVGAIALGIGSGLAIAAKSSYDDSEDHCLANSCDPEGLDIRDSAIGQADIATVILAVGGATLVGGGILWLTAPDDESASESGKSGAWTVGLAPMGLSLRGAW